MWLSRISSSQSSKRSLNRSWITGVEHVFEGVADGGTLDQLVEATHELVVYRLVHDHRAERCAALPAVPNR